MTSQLHCLQCGLPVDSHRENCHDTDFVGTRSTSGATNDDRSHERWHHGSSRFSAERKGRGTGAASTLWLLPWLCTKRWTGAKFAGFWTLGTNPYLDKCWKSSIKQHGLTRARCVNTSTPEQNTHLECLISDTGYSNIHCPLSNILLTSHSKIITSLLTLWNSRVDCVLFLLSAIQMALRNGSTKGCSEYS